MVELIKYSYRSARVLGIKVARKHFASLETLLAGLAHEDKDNHTCYVYRENGNKVAIWFYDSVAVIGQEIVEGGY